jgi:hypothetical protein
MAGRPSWTEGQVATLRDLWPTGMAVAEIAMQAGMTSRATASKAYRLGLERREKLSLDEIEKRAAERIAKYNLPPLIGCRYPLWNNREKATMVFCGQPTIRIGVDWCATHYRRVYTTPPPKGWGHGA